MKLLNKKVAVVGLGKTGQALVRLLIKEKANVNILDQNKNSTYSLKKLPVKFNLGKNYLKNLGQFDTIFISPGVPLNLPEFRKVKNKISSEMELFFELCPAKIIGVTGTNGKTTVTTLASAILKKGKRKVFTGGNIGLPLINKVAQIKKEDLVILELSSFQLELLKQSPWIAVILNITPDHLDRYENFNQYKKAKGIIIKYQKKNDRAILNFDDKKVLALKNKIKAEIWGYSVTKEINRGTFIKNTSLIIKDKKIVKNICSIKDIKLPGKHNLANILAASLIGYLEKIPTKKIKKSILEFRGVPHRLEFIKKVDSRKFYNDSKATTPESTIAALKSFSDPIILIAGGYDKHANYKELVNVINNKVSSLILIGQTAKKIALECNKQKIEAKIHMAKSLVEATKKAYSVSFPNDIILLSPACASFDMFKNFEERGIIFKKYIQKIH